MLKMNHSILFVICLLAVTTSCDEQSLNRAKLLNQDGYTAQNARCKQTYKIRNICQVYSGCDTNPPKDPSMEVIEVTCEDLSLSYCYQYTARLELQSEDGSKHSFTQDVACVFIVDVVQKSETSNAAGLIPLILIAVGLLAGVIVLILRNFRLRRILKGLDSNINAKENKKIEQNGTVNEGLDLEEA